jgi:hypothetical protein
MIYKLKVKPETAPDSPLGNIGVVQVSKPFDKVYSKYLKYVGYADTTLYVGPPLERKSSWVSLAVARKVEQRRM